MEIKGKLKVKGEAQQVSDKFKKREFVLTDDSNSQYPQHIQFQLTQDKCGLLDKFTIGSEVRVHFNLNGRQWTSPQGEEKYFNTLDAWKLEESEGSSGNSNGSTSNGPKNDAPTPNSSQNTSSSSSSSDDDDLPF